MQPARLIIVLLIALAASLFAGTMVGTAGGAVYTPLYRAAAPLMCGGEFLIESQSYSYKPGQSGVAHTIYCRDPATGAREEITTPAVLAATLVYAALAFPFALLSTWAVARSLGRKRVDAPAVGLGGSGWPTAARGPSVGTQVVTNSHTVFVYDGRTYTNPDEIPAEARAAYEKVSNVFADADGDGLPDLLENLGAFTEAGAESRPAPGVAERLTNLNRLRDAGLISPQEYEAKRAEILSEL